jgi:hypothetical protein
MSISRTGRWIRLSIKRIRIRTARQTKATEKAFVMLLNSNIKQKNNDPSAKYRQGHLRVAENLQGCIRAILHPTNRGQGIE